MESFRTKLKALLAEHKASIHPEVDFNPGEYDGLTELMSSIYPDLKLDSERIDVKEMDSAINLLRKRDLR